MPRKKIPHFRFYCDDFINGTKGMAASEVGDYIRLLAHLYDQGGRVPNEPAVLRHLLECNRTRDATAKIARLVSLGKLFVDTQGYLHNGRTDKEIDKRGQWQDGDRRNGTGGLRSPISQPSTRQKKSMKTMGAGTLAQEPYSSNNKSSPTEHYIHPLNGSAASGASHGFEGRYAPPLSTLTRQLIAKGLHRT